MNQAALWLRRGLTTGLTLIAFWNSYSHTAQWFRDQGQKGQAGWLALIPEVGVVLVVLTLAGGPMSRPLRWVIGAFGVGSLSLTLTANVSAAGPGFMGLIAALVAPVFAVLGFALEVLSLMTHRDEPADEPVQDEPMVPPAGVHEPAVVLPPVVHELTGEPVVVQVPKVQRTTVNRSTGGLMDTGILWATEQMSRTNEWPTTPEIMVQFPEMSRSTAKRVRASVPAGTDGTAKSEESVNA